LPCAAIKNTRQTFSKKIKKEPKPACTYHCIYRLKKNNHYNTYHISFDVSKEDQV
jgi:hypothetical protein